MPKTSTTIRRTDRIAVRVDRDMPDWLQKEADKKQETVSGVIRQLIRDAMTTAEDVRK